MATGSVSRTFLSVAAAYPLYICFRDSFYSICRVHGTSMEPTLKHGDLLLIRKADFPRFRWFHNNKKKNNNNNHDDDDDDLLTERRLRELEYQQAIHRQQQQEDWSIWFRCPPLPIRGQIITYRSPYQYPSELCIKRVVAVAGQVVETEKGLQDVDINSLWVEGENHKNSSDSRTYGCINQKLLVGVAEYCLWPPSRIGKIKTKIDDKRSYWQ